MANPGLTRARIVLSVLGVIVSFGLAALAVCLIAFGSTHKQATLGALAGVWSALLGYLSIYGVRRHPESSAGSSSPGSPATELELARSREVETTRDGAERREYEERLHALVQSELGRISETMNSELHALQDQVAELRGELVEKVGGQLRLERVETTRVIGSNIEALQHEVRRLAVGRDDLGILSRGPSAPMNAIDATTEIPPVEPSPPVQPPPAPPTPTVTPPAPPVIAATVIVPEVFKPVPPPVVTEPPARPPVGPPIVVAAPPPSPAVSTAVSTPAPIPPPVPAPSFAADPFAGLPRLSRFTDEGAPPDEASSPAGTAPAPVPAPSRSRHALADEPPAVEPPRAGGRRRRADDEPNDILERLLESHS